MAIIALFSACKEQEPPFSDPHSVANYHEAKATHLNLLLKVNFEDEKLAGQATWDVTLEKSARFINFDIGHLEIDFVSTNLKDNVPFEIITGKVNSGNGIQIPVENGVKQITIGYQTPARKTLAPALQWLKPEQTAGKEHPFLFTQSQAILARTWIPCQDGPGMRFTYEAQVNVPSNLMALMSASNPKMLNELGVYHFIQNKPIPAYLMALAVGNLVVKEPSDRNAIYAEPEIVSAAAEELQNTDLMIDAAESLYGAYAWERYDILILPPSFPFGGMENPMLTFATPTILAGDRSLTSLIAHELAHSWSGNLVTNATWNDFWLNEGFTVYFERRIMEVIEGKEYAEMLASLGKQDLIETITSLNPADTHLKLQLDNRNPDDGMNDIAYEKGYFLLRLIEGKVGRDAFDQFLKNYFKENAFKSLTTEDFLKLLKRDLLKKGDYEALQIDAWVYGPGLPSNCPVISNSKFNAVDNAFSDWLESGHLNAKTSSMWSTHEWLHFIRKIDAKKVGINHLAALDKEYQLTSSNNSEIICAWLLVCIPADYQPAIPATENFLVKVGRRKFVKPLFQALLNKPELHTVAQKIYEKAKPNYHEVTVQTIDAMMVKLQ